MMARSRGYSAVLNKYNPGGPYVNTAGWHLKSLTEAYETSEDNRMAANEAALVVMIAVPAQWLDKLGVAVIAMPK